MSSPREWSDLTTRCLLNERQGRRRNLVCSLGLRIEQIPREGGRCARIELLAYLLYRSRTTRGYSATRGTRGRAFAEDHSMIDLTTETPLSLAAAAKLLPPARNGRRCHLSTVLRWILRGAAVLPGQGYRAGRIRIN